MSRTYGLPSLRQFVFNASILITPSSSSSFDLKEYNTIWQSGCWSLTIVRAAVDLVAIEASILQKVAALNMVSVLEQKTVDYCNSTGNIGYCPRLGARVDPNRNRLHDKCRHRERSIRQCSGLHATQSCPSHMVHIRSS